VAIEFGEFCRIASERKPEDNPLVKIAVSMLSSTKKIFDKYADEIPYSILLPVSKNLIVCREDLSYSGAAMSEVASWASDANRYLVEELAGNKLA
jgi:hypothetical protein